MRVYGCYDTYTGVLQSPIDIWSALLFLLVLVLCFFIFFFFLLWSMLDQNICIGTFFNTTNSTDLTRRDRGIAFLKSTLAAFISDLVQLTKSPRFLALDTGILVIIGKETNAEWDCVGPR